MKSVSLTSLSQRLPQLPVSSTLFQTNRLLSCTRACVCVFFLKDKLAHATYRKGLFMRLPPEYFPN